MSLEPYPEYKDSGVESLGKVPTEWDVISVSRFVTFGNGADYKHVEVAEGGYPVIGSGGEFRRASEYLFDGESVLFGRKGTVSKPLYVNGKFWTVDTMYYTHIDTRYLVPKFLYYWALRIPFDFYLTNTALPSMTQTDLGSAKIALPTPVVQKEIVQYLDRETAEIDAFIADQERLIELLEERRVATITHAVTKGLDSTVHMRDSGVAWLGRVPSHWEMSSLRHLLKSPLKYGANEPATSADPEQVRYLRITDFDQRGQLREETFRSLPEEIARNYMVLPNDVLLARSGATVGKAFIVPEDSPPACFAGYLIRVDVSREKILPEYFFLYTQTASFEAWKNLVMIQATIQNISAEKYASLKVPLPPLDEQRHIVQDLSKEISKIDTAIADAREAIALSEERRAALISAAVTGQLDVSQAQRSVDEVLEQGVRV